MNQIAQKPALGTKQESEISLSDFDQKVSNPASLEENKIAVSSSILLFDEQSKQLAAEKKKDLQREYERQKKAKQRKSKMENQDQTLLVRAKQVLKENLYEIAELKQQGILDKLSPKVQKSLRKFIVNFRQQEKKAPSESPKVPQSKLKITEEQQNTISNIQVCRNELISKELCGCQNIENLIAVMAGWNRKNHPAIFEFLKSLQQVPFANFFEALIVVIQDTPDLTQQVRLLIGLFGIYNGQKLNSGPDLCVQTLKYLANEDGVTSQQVIGFLKFTFITDGDIHNADLSDLVEFDKRHKQCFVGFKQWLQRSFHLPADLTFVLPNSCYILGLPFAKRLQNGGNVLTEHIPSDFLGLFIETLAFSFEREDEPFVDFLNVAKKSFLDLMEKIKTTQLINLFSGLLDQVLSHDRQWYLNIRNSKRLIEGAFALVKENKVRIFDNEVCQNLLFEVTNVDQHLAAPSFIKSCTSQVNEGQFKRFLALNQKSRVVQKFLRAFDISQSLPEEIINNFLALKITPHFIQELAMKIISQKACSHCFLNIAPGLGKTKLILAVAIDLVQTTGLPVFVLNSSETLSDRDFQEATISLEALKIACASVISQRAKITFSTTEDFIGQKDNLPENYHTLLDEYHNIFFVEKLFLWFVEIVKSSESFIGFSGSPLNSSQKKLLEQSFDKQTMVLQLTPHTDLGDHETVLCKTQVLHVKKLAEIANEYRYESPQVFILDSSTANALLKGKKSQRYENLIDKEPAIVNNMLTDLFNKPNDKGEYGTFIINEEMGTGTDFKTSSDIESKGGLVLVFGIKPTNTSTFEQLSCRVGRIFNKGRRFYVIQDATYTGPNRDYLKFQLKILGQKECEEARALLSKLKPDINNVTSINNHDDDEDEHTGNMLINENEGDFEMDDATSNQVSHANKDESNSFEGNDESFVAQGSESKLLRLQKQKQHKGTNKRTKKYKEKIILKQEKLGETEECKFCGDDLVDPHVCKKENKSQQREKQSMSTKVGQQRIYAVQQLQECKICQKECTCEQRKKQYDEISTKQNNTLNADQFIRNQSEIIVEQTPEVAFVHNNIPEEVDTYPKENFLVQNSDINMHEMGAQLKRSNNNTADVEDSIRRSGRNKKQKVQVVITREKTQRELIDGGYFKNYSDPKIHKEMLNDKVMVQTYQKAIELACKGKQVLDLGCGNGVLSAFAIKSGAEQVYAVDNADIQDIMTEQLGKMGVDFTKIKYIQGSIESLTAEEIPQVDVIVSEWMGYFLVFENMIGSYIYAKKYLKADGIMIPQQADLHLNPAAYAKTKRIAKKYRQGKCKFVKVVLCEPKDLIQEESVVIHTLDFAGADLQNPLDQGFSQDFGIAVGKSGLFNAFVGSFDVKLYEGVFLNTMPTCQETHWKQSLFFIDNPIEVSEGDIIQGTIKVNVDQENYRNLIVKFTYEVEGKGGSQTEECFTFE